MELVVVLLITCDPSFLHVAHDRGARAGELPRRSGRALC